MADVKSEPVENGESIKEEKKSEAKVNEGKNNPVENGDSGKVKEEISSSKDDSISELERKIIEQVEYYFGDCNLPRDKFLQEQIKLDDGWVPLEILIKFNRLAKLSTDLEVIASALKKSNKGLLEISEDNKKIRREPSHVLPEMNEARRQELMDRSLYVKGFPTELELDQLLQYFAKYAKVEQLIMRKYQDKAEKKWVFKGSVFAIFPSIGEAEKFLKLENMKYEETDLIIKWQKDYLADKKNERLQLKLESQNKKRKLRNAGKEDDDDGDEEEEKKDGLAEGAALYLSDCPPELTREEVKSKIEEFGIAVAYLYFNKGDNEGWVRLQEPNTAVEVVKNLKDGKLELEGHSVSVRALEGEEETKFLEKVKNDMSKRRNMNRNHKGKKGRGGPPGNFRRKRRGSPIREGGGGKAKKSAEANSD